MQTFVPFADYLMSATVLDMKRLGKQRVETLQILNTLSGNSKGWVNHPAVRMWQGHELALVDYGVTFCKVWTNLGYKDTCTDKITALRKSFPKRSASLPSWWGDQELHDSHKSKLLQKDPVWYGRFDWSVPTDLDYIWPIKEQEK